MKPTNNDFSSEVKLFVNSNKILCAVTLGLAVAVYALGNLAGKAVSWIAECAGTTKKTDTVAQKSFDTIPSRHETQSDIPMSKGIEPFPKAKTDLPIILQADKSQSSFKITNWRDANPHICNQVREMWPRRIEKFTQGVPEGDRIVCITEGDKLVGCVALEQLTITEPPELVQKVGAQKVYKLDIQVHHNYQGKGHGRTVFNNACSLVIEEGALVFLVDMAAQGVGDRLYGGEKTRELFDVYHVLKGDRGEYLLKEKTQEKNNLNYIKIDPSNAYIFFECVESPEGMNHLIHYLEAHPEDISLIDSSIISTCDSIIKICKDSWSGEELAKYNESVHKLRMALHQSI